MPVKGYEVIYHGEAVNIPYPQESGDDGRISDPGKRPEGRSFHHGRFIQRLRQAARSTNNVTLIETKVTELVKGGFAGQIIGVESDTQGKKDYVRSLLYLSFKTTPLTSHMILSLSGRVSILVISPSSQTGTPPSFASDSFDINRSIDRNSTDSN